MKAQNTIEFAFVITIILFVFGLFFLFISGYIFDMSDSVGNVRAQQVVDGVVQQVELALQSPGTFIRTFSIQSADVSVTIKNGSEIVGMFDDKEFVYFLPDNTFVHAHLCEDGRGEHMLYKDEYGIFIVCSEYDFFDFFRSSRSVYQYSCFNGWFWQECDQEFSGQGVAFYCAEPYASFNDTDNRYLITQQEGNRFVYRGQSDQDFVFECCMDDICNMVEDPLVMKFPESPVVNLT
ncbi:MAG: hypothetical protein ACMXYC_03480, partial [Candidatus Woesearchaeota archaeon]